MKSIGSIVLSQTRILSPNEDVDYDMVSINEKKKGLREKGSTYVGISITCARIDDRNVREFVQWIVRFILFAFSAV